MQITLFVDYDNLGFLQKRAGLLDLATKALMARSLRTRDVSGRCEIRVYGGWYEGPALTPLAQRIAAEIQNDFPLVLRCPTEHNIPCSIISQAELAYALIEEPTHHLLDTYRKKRFPYNLKLTDPKELGCVVPHCPLGLLPKLFDKAECPEGSCAIKLNDIIYRSEQKLVDTMLTCDMIHAAGKGDDLIIVVSGDDDLLPSIRTATLRGTPVIRIHPKPFTKGAAFPIGGAPLFEQVL